MPWQFGESRFVHTNLNSVEERKDLALLRKWVVASPDLSKTTSSHWWFSKLNPKEKDAFSRVADSDKIKAAFYKRFPASRYEISRIDGMNEIYATGPPVKGTSDEVFYTRHIDGPFQLFRFASVYRCLVGLDDNTQTVTKFPMIPTEITASTGDMFGFDFNREIHYIERDPSRAASKDQRIVLKLHFTVYPKLLRPWGLLLGRLNVLYNVLFRALFLKTIRPSTVFEDLLARYGVVGVTKLVHQVEEFAGYNNLMYIGLVATLSYAFGSYAIFLVATSFVHYIRYIMTYYYRDNVAYLDFKRDVLIFKSLALAQLAYLYLSPHGFNPVSALTADPISVLMIASGYGVSMLATKALGLDRTYFGVELGFCEPKWIDAFPYSTIPHPMITSQVFALLGILKGAGSIRASFPWLLPLHIALYLAHMLQEILDVHGSKVHQKTADLKKD